MAQNETVLAGVLEIFRHNPQKQFSVDQIERQARRDRLGNFTDLVKALAYLEQKKQIITDGNGRYQLAQENTEVEGVFRANDKGFGFVRLDDEEADDVFINSDATKLALDGDRVKVKITAGGNPWNGKGPEGQVEEILERGASSIVGEYTPLEDLQAKISHFAGYVISTNKKFKKYRVYVSENGLIPQMGDMVKVSLKTYPTEDLPDQMTGAVVEIIGNKNDPGVDIMSIVAEHDIRTEWPEDALEQANAIPDHVTEEERHEAGRRDITDQPAVTIDGDDSKDFDDAVVLWKLDNGNYHLGVHIADVAHYVKEGTPLDREAFARGNSTYLVDRVIPMLPFRLSNGICSLNEGVDRLVLSCDMEITPEGERVSYDIYPAVMRSHGRLTYNKVNQALRADVPDSDLEDKYVKVRPMLKDMAALHEALYNKRHARGAIDFEEPEAKIIVDEKGKPVDIVLHSRGTAEKMIESFMLLANETVAEAYYRKKVPFLYRVHETPEADRITRFFEFCSAFGLNVKADPNDIEPLDLQKVVTKTLGTPEEAVLQMMLLRSLKQAHYSEDPLGHFGIAAKYYTHFTSPIRRYSDTMAHRMIHAYLEEGMGDEVKEHFKEELPEVADQTSMQERRSIDTERATNDLKMTEYMADQVGNKFEAVISSVTSFGMFVQLENTVEGLIHISNLKDDYYSYDEKTMTLTGRATHKKYKVGMPIKVVLTNANVEQHQLDFEVYDPDAKKRPHNDRGMGRRSGDRNFKGRSNYGGRDKSGDRRHKPSRNNRGQRLGQSERGNRRRPNR
ncbi:ribonuclease R [Lactobacillus delbrueckii subsp. delbrueckii]|uniref:ribonuclease R n=1 Tax=Lactobacillus delbrueckii TaxID=1584 RepID=UPI000A2FE02D|nr:ribonuclease R [Lactobacillus delbrueckii]ARR37304.1 ribonuclease R [Lactobacillus delbrueckii subsp. delbrueckii]MCD5452012.1 ribonuclease R [Lactobacillus delbrueckii subsp. lactis]BBL28209.1 ribonuclease R [Lactobacillus delbrueckii subsp. delbrueckii]GEA75619.1 ribonuclease R [Lactobacillus delbrueckii subsp. delbrueckii]GHN53955.1 exoribonuclease R [Lactobacillus delbrueckii]